MIALLAALTNEDWVAFWKIVVLTALVGFGSMGLIVSVGAVKDLFAMLRDIAAGEDGDDGS